MDLPARCRKSALSVAVAMAIAMANSPTIAQAQQAAVQGDSQLDEIIITAQRREQNLLEVPISVSVYTQEAMDIQGVRDMADIAKFTPSLTFNKSDGLRAINPSISIRGVTTGAGESTTGIYINDTPIAVRNLTASGGSNGAAYPYLFDLERVEVLRGPQGTLYGSGSQGGTVRFISPQPSLTGSSMYVRAGTSVMTYGSPGYEFGVAGGMPIITDRLGFRGSISTSQTGGYIDHGNWYTGQVDEPNYNWNRTWSVRAALKWAPIENLEISPAFFHQEEQVRGLGTFYLPDDVPNERLGLNPGDVGYIDTSPGSYYARHLGDWDNYGHFGEGVSSGHYVNGSRVLPNAKQYMDLYSLDLKYALQSVELTYNASMYENRLNSLSDFATVLLGTWSNIVAGDWTPFPSDPALAAPTYGNNKNRSLTQEFRIQNSNPDSRFEWVAGAYWQKLKLAEGTYNDVPNFALLFRDTVNPSPCTTVADCTTWMQDNVHVAMYQNLYPVWVRNAADSDQQAVFGQVDFHATDHLTVTIGERYSRMSYKEHSFKAGIYYGALGTYIDGQSKVSASTPKFGLKWTTDAGNMYYLSAAKGVRNGGSNPPVMTNPQCAERLKSAWNIDEPPLMYQPDSVWSYELGTKFRIADNKLTVNADVFQIDWSDIIRSVPIGGTCILSFMTNLGTAQSRGAELDVQYKPTSNLLLSLNGGYAKVQSTSTIPVPDSDDPTKPKLDAQGRKVLITRKGAILPGSHTTATFAAQYSFTAFEKPSYARLDYQYSGTPSKGDNWDPQSSQYSGAAMLFETPAINTANLRVGTRVNDWDVSLYVNNLTNSQPIFKSRVQSGVAWMTGSTIAPRTAGVTAVFRY